MRNASPPRDVGNRLTAALALEIDRKAKEALTGDSDYKLGKWLCASFVGIARTVPKNGDSALVDVRPIAYFSFSCSSSPDSACDVCLNSMQTILL